MINETGGAAEPNRTVDAAPTPDRPASLRRVLIIERDPESVQVLSGKLVQAGFDVAVVAGTEGEAAYEALERSPDLVMLDWDLPAVITMQLVQRARRRTTDGMPRVMVFSSFAGEQHVVSGFEQGVDDYVVKPFSVPEVVARAHAVLRPLRAGSTAPCEQLEFGALTLDAAESRLTAGECPVALRSKELRLLAFLMRHPERAFTRETLLRRVWGFDCRVGQRAVNVTVQRIRQALAPHGCAAYLQCVRGVGYVLSERALR